MAEPVQENVAEPVETLETLVSAIRDTSTVPLDEMGVGDVDATRVLNMEKNGVVVTASFNASI